MFVFVAPSKLFCVLPEMTVMITGETQQADMEAGGEALTYGSAKGIAVENDKRKYDRGENAKWIYYMIRDSRE